MTLNVEQNETLTEDVRTPQ